MNAQKYSVVIVGGGTGGITVAAQLKKKQNNLDIVIVDPSENHYYQPAWTLVGAGAFSMADTIRDQVKVIPSGVDWLKESVEEILPEKNTLITSTGLLVQYDYLVLSPGVQYDFEALKGLTNALGKDGVCSNYIDPEYTYHVLKNFKGGNALFTQADTPIKCGGAPQKIMYLAAEYFKKHNISSSIIYAFPGSVIFGVSDFAKTLLEVVDRHNIILKHKYSLIEIDEKKKRAIYTCTSETLEGISRNDPNNRINEVFLAERQVAIPYDMLHLAPPQTAPDFIKKGQVAYQDGPNKGWIEVDVETLQHKRYSNIYGLGDAAALPTAKTGAAIRKQAPVLVANLLSQMKGKSKGGEKYNGYSSCPIVTGYGKMMLAEFGYENIRMSDPLLSKVFDLTKESKSMWLLKKYGLPIMYWDFMLKGRA